VIEDQKEASDCKGNKDNKENESPCKKKKEVK